MKKFVQSLALLGAFALPLFCQTGQLSPDDQREFDRTYSKWMNDTQRNDRDDVERDVRRMREIMSRNNISPDTPYNQIASGASSDGDRAYGNERAYPQTDRPYPSSGRAQLAPEDQRDFDRYYSRWVDDSQRGDRDDAERDMHHMREIMERNNIPPDVPPDQIANHSGYANRDDDRGYARPDRNRSGLSPDDQREFDRVYAKWVRDSRRNDRDDLDRDVHRMQDIMARYNIPSNVPYDQIASPEAGERH